MDVDKRALGILTDMFWSPAGWKREPTVSPEDFAYAKAQGLMFDPVSWSHDQAVSKAIDAVSRTSKEAVARAFLSSLQSRRLDLRSALGSYAVGRHLKPHPKVSSGTSPSCRHCGGCDTAVGDLNLLNFERMRWGGVRHDHPGYIAFDLGVFVSLGEVGSAADGIAILRSILAAAGSLPSGARLGDLERAIAGMLPSNSAERRTLIGILGFGGILIDPARPDYRTGFVPIIDREPTPWHKDDWPYPVQWWNGSCGVNWAAVDEWFPGLR